MVLLAELPQDRVGRVKEGVRCLRRKSMDCHHLPHALGFTAR